MRTRIAPTPSGFLHEGNLYNFLLTQRVADELGLELRLRIDDLDAFRLREEYVADIFRCLQWLGIEWSGAPQTLTEYRERVDQPGRIDHYYDRLEAMIDAGLPAFVCKCSRRELSREARCEQGCRGKQLKLVAGKTAIRVHVPPSPVGDTMGDFIVWRREDLPAYQLQSLIDDDESGITHIVRGEDLLDSTSAQLYLAAYLPSTTFAQIQFMHHGLVMGNNGVKLSKSQGTDVLALTSELMNDLRDMVADTEIEFESAAEISGGTGD